MAVYTNIESYDLIHFMTHYDLGQLLSFSGISTGTDNTNYLVKTTKSSYILTLYESRVKKKDLPFFMELMHYFANHDIPCAQPIADRNGLYYRNFIKNPASFISFIEGESYTIPTVDHCKEVGKTVANLHNVGVNFSGQRPNDLGLSAWEELITKWVHHLSPDQQNHITQELIFLKTHWPQNLSKGAIHADLFPDNVFFKESTVSGIIDFYFSCTDFLIYDLAICLNAWCFDKNLFNSKKGQVFLNAYQMIRPLPKIEQEYLPFMARAAALRFFVTRMTDWLFRKAGPLVHYKDPQEYWDILCFHQKITSYKDYVNG
ncbi:MAG: homoserine kinase [Alphaproteobacteria bacterium]|nr:homoserine kinase [Alphaproteobacteria bacterium]